MPTGPRPLYVWRIWFRLRAEGMHPAALAELRARLGSYDARASIEGNELRVAMRVVGHVGPASAIGDAAMMLGHHAANSGFRNARIDFVQAERVSATAAG